MEGERKDIINQLRKDILALQGIKPITDENIETFGLGPIESAFPNGVCPRGVVHEFLITEEEHEACSAGFLSGLLKVLMQNGSSCLWISAARTLFPPALNAFGIEPDRIIFVDLQNEKEALWVMEEALQCEGLTAVVTELRELNFAQSRRLQLLAERSKVTGFVMRTDPDKITTTTCISRWRISPIPSKLEKDMPGVGFPRWNVELLKVKNGNPGSWEIEWADHQFRTVTAAEKAQKTPIDQQSTALSTRKTG